MHAAKLLLVSQLFEGKGMNFFIPFHLCYVASLAWLRAQVL